MKPEFYMAKLNTEKRPAVVRVRSESRAEEIAEIANKAEIKFIIGVETDMPESLFDLKKALKAKKVSFDFN